MSDFLDSHILVIPVTVPRKKAAVPATIPPPLTHRAIGEIAEEIVQDWKKVNFAAVPYLEALLTLNRATDTYGPGKESARTLIAYFLNNAGSWRGPVAKRVKAELKQIAGIK